MNKQVTRFRNQIERLYKQLKQPNITNHGYLQTLIELEKCSQQYIAALAYDDTLNYLDFFSIIDVLNDNIEALKEKVKR